MDPIAAANVFATAPVPWIIAAGAAAAVSALAALGGAAPLRTLRTAAFLGGIAASCACLTGGLIAA